MKALRRVKGAYIVIMAILLVVLIAFGALALDLGRLFVLRSEMQNAADAAALAAAVELRGNTGARGRAEAVARNALQYDSKFAEVTELLGSNISLEFFCAIGSEYDPDDIAGFCINPYVEGRSLAASDAEARYVRVILAADDEEEGEPYSVELFFLPVLNVYLDDVSTRGFLSTAATAGRQYYMCDYPPVIICNPYELLGTDFADEMTPGEQVTLKQQGGNSWAPGNMAFLEPFVGGGGAPAVAEYLADEGLMGCTPPIITTEPGNMTNQTASAINTRFDIYENPSPFNKLDAPDNWPPAPNVIDYPRDQTFKAVDSRFGLGDWDRDAYFDTYHDWKYKPPPPGEVCPVDPIPPTNRPFGWQSMSRWDVYNWELENDRIPSMCPLVLPQNTDTTYEGYPDPLHVYTGEYPPPRSLPDRRNLHVAVVNCLAHNLSGTQTFPMVNPEGFVELFLTEHVQPPPDADIWVEFIKWSDESDEELHIDIQLYE